MWKTPNGIGGVQTPIGPADTVRFVTNDFMYTGGDGYTVFTQGTNVLQPGDDLMQVAIDYVDCQLTGRSCGGRAHRRSVIRKVDRKIASLQAVACKLAFFFDGTSSPALERVPGQAHV